VQASQHCAALYASPDTVTVTGSDVDVSILAIMFDVYSLIVFTMMFSC
jgi:hypothetical protein